MAREKADPLIPPGFSNYLWGLLECLVMQIMGGSEGERKREELWRVKQELSLNLDVWQGLYILGSATTPSADLASFV